MHEVRGAAENAQAASWPSPARSDLPASLQVALSSRESDVLELVADGLSNEGIGKRLFVSPKTVESVLSSVFLKLGLAEDGRDGNRRVKAAMYFVASRNVAPQVSLGDSDLMALLSSAPFDTAVNVLEQRAVETEIGAWSMLAAASWCLAIGDDLDHAIVLAERSRADIALLPDGDEAGAARVIVDGLTATLQVMRGSAAWGGPELDEVRALSALPPKHRRRVVFDAMESVLEIANWFTFGDRTSDAAAILDRRLDRSQGDDDFSQNSALCCLGELEIRRGRWRRCDESIARLLDRESSAGQPSGYAHALAARLNAGRGDIAVTRSHLRLARAAATARGDRSTHWRTDAAEGLLLLGNGDPHGAAAVLGPLVERADESGVRLPSVRMWEGDLVEAQVRSGDMAGARLTTKWLETDVGATGSRWGAATLMRCKGLVASTPTEAAAEFESSAAAFGRIDAPFEQARSGLLLGECAAGTGLGGAAIHLARALDVFESIGALPWAASARRLAG